MLRVLRPQTTIADDDEYTTVNCSLPNSLLIISFS
ncbi:unnamed protein product [Tenebrio molitor]|nr:unnamed protein product [Tenebrio molitor]